ncbi:hypothetical protein [Pseudarthrobacter sp. YAF2]
MGDEEGDGDVFDYAVKMYLVGEGDEVLQLVVSFFGVDLGGQVLQTQRLP